MSISTKERSTSTETWLTENLKYQNKIFEYHQAEVYLRPCQTPMMEFFAKILKR